MEKAKKFKSMDFGFQGHFYRPPSPIKEEIDRVSVEEKPPEETNSKFKAIQYRLDI